MLATAEQPPSLGVWAGYSHNVRRSFAAALLHRLFGNNCPRPPNKGATGRVRIGDQLYPLLCHCKLGQDIPYIIAIIFMLYYSRSSPSTATGTVTAARVRVRLDDTKLYQSRWTRPGLPASGRTSPSNGLVTAAAWEAQFFLPVPGWVASAAGT